MRFSIRDLLWATLMVAMGLAWWLDHQRQEELRREAVRDAITLRRIKGAFAGCGNTGSSTPRSPDLSPLDESIIEP